MKLKTQIVVLVVFMILFVAAFGFYNVRLASQVTNHADMLASMRTRVLAATVIVSLGAIFKKSLALRKHLLLWPKNFRMQ